MYKQKYLKYKEKYLMLKGGGGKSIFPNPFSRTTQRINNTIRSFIDNTKSIVPKLKIPKQIDRSTTKRIVDISSNISAEEKVQPSAEVIDTPSVSAIEQTSKQHISSAKPTETIPYVDTRDTEDVRDIFYIYTTGINTDEHFNTLWFDKLRDNILTQIPETFNKQIIHYDNTPIDNIVKFNELMMDGEFFICRNLPYKNLEHPHIIIDMANMFSYYPYYNPESKYNVYINSAHESKLYGNKAITIGNLREDIAESKLINVNSSGNVITFIDKLIEFNLIDIHTHDIEPIINKLVRRYIKNKFYRLGKLKADVKKILKQYNLYSMFINNLLVCDTFKNINDITTYEDYTEIKEKIDLL